jgi:hypothetical protein
MKFEPGDYVEVVGYDGIHNILCWYNDRSVDDDDPSKASTGRLNNWFYVKSGSRGVVLGASRTKYSDTSDGYLPVQLESRRGWIRERFLRKLS